MRWTEKLCCSICLDLLKDPVTIPCGHNYCMNCIRSYWDEKDQKETHSCPQCRQIFSPRPALVRNAVISDLVEETKTGRRRQAAKADLCHAESGDVACDVCSGKKLKAVKSCLQYLVSYCDHHLQPHYESPAFKRHKLVDPSEKLHENICSRHNEVMKIFCRTDQQCICYLCSLDEHEEHNTVSAAAEMSEKQKELKVSQQNIQQRIKEKEKNMKVLQQEISELKRRKAELEQLSHTEDPTQFLHNYTLLPCLGEATDLPNINIHPQRYTEDVTAAVSEAKDKLQDILSEEWTKTSLRGTEGEFLLPQTEPRTRAEFLKYKCHITFNLNTAHQYITVEPGLQVKYSYNQYSRYPTHPDRFTHWSQVLCRQSLTGRCYWEVEWKAERESCDFFKAVAYKDISRSGGQSAFGYNDRSWALECFCGGYEFRHEGTGTFIKGPQSSRIGVYLDHSAGILSFYSVSETTETMTLLHRVQTRFSQPLLVVKVIAVVVIGYKEKIISLNQDSH